MPVNHFRFRSEGKEYGPYPRKQVEKYFLARKYSDNTSIDAVWDPVERVWVSVDDWLPQPESAVTFEQHFDRLTMGTMYQKITISGVIIFLLWGSVFIGIRISTGKWPGQGAPAHHNPVPVGEYADDGDTVRFHTEVPE